MIENGFLNNSLLVGILAGAMIFSAPAFSAGGQVPFAVCKVTVHGKDVGFSKLTTTAAWYKAHGYEQTLKATLAQNLYPMLNSKFGKGKYKATCNKTL